MYRREDDNISLARKRATDMDSNRRVFLPQARPDKEEAENEVRKNMWNKVITNFTKANCDDKGNQKVRNLTRAEL